MNPLLFASATTTERRTQDAAHSLADQVNEQLNGARADLALVFMSAHFASLAAAVGRSVRDALAPRLLLGVTAEGVIGRTEELESEPAITLLALHAPALDICPFALEQGQWDAALATPDELRRRISAPEDTRLFLVIADPFSTPAGAMLEAFDQTYPGVPMSGGMASGAYRPDSNVLLLNDRFFTSGAVGLALAGDFEADLIVAQGCRPVGHPFRVTAAERNVIIRLDDEPPLARIWQLAEEFTPAERALLRTSGIFIGRAVDPDKPAPGRGDFVIHGLMGLDHESGVMVVADYIRPGELIQFHLRDQRTARDDLEMMLLPHALGDPPRGALLFACNGRGMRLYDHPNGDISIVQKVLGGINVAGFFCQGEFGPLGGKNRLHAHTASMVLFRPAEA